MKSEPPMVQILQLLVDSPGGMTHGELRADLPGMSANMLRLSLHQLRKLELVRPSVSQRGGRAPLAQLVEDATPARHVLGLSGAAALIMRRVLAGDVLSSAAQVEQRFAQARPGEYTQASKAVYTLRARGLLGAGWPLVRLGGVDYSFED